MDNNTLERKILMEETQVRQYPNGQVEMKPPGKYWGRRWRYKDNPWNGIGEKEYRTRFAVWDNTPPWNHSDAVE
jgi:hypothetical protein